jgi:hypothetical protein
MRPKDPLVAGALCHLEQGSFDQMQLQQSGQLLSRHNIPPALCGRGCDRWGTCTKDAVPAGLRIGPLELRSSIAELGCFVRAGGDLVE